ncbi:hypothetical protein [Actinokineospora sp.]|uniref:hypothetical protein n=1 Tax=Actinokineospora sp. TaxID=1872133 RepID=UPI004037E12A
MIEDMMAQFAQMQRYATALQNLVAGAQEHAPRESEGADPTKSVHVTLGPDGLPTTFRVDTEWERKMGPETFGGAVVEAFQAAIGERLSAWTSALAEDGWQDRVDKLKGGLTGAPDKGRIPPAFRKPDAEDIPARPVGDLSEQVIKAFDNIDVFSAQSAARGVGTGMDRSGKLTIVLSTTGLTSCSADAHWVGEQTAARLMNALGEALAAAKADLAANAEKPAPNNGMDQVLAEAMALLNDPRRLAD